MSQSGIRSKKSILHDMRKGAQSYRELLDRSVTIIHCDDGSRYEMHWDKNRFRHLIGLTYKDGPAGRFYDDVLRGKVKLSSIGYREGIDFAQRKGRVIGHALALRDACYVVVSGNNGIAVYYGGLEWSLGLVKDADGLQDSYGEPVYHPASIRDDVHPSRKTDSLSRLAGRFCDGEVPLW